MHAEHLESLKVLKESFDEWIASSEEHLRRFSVFAPSAAFVANLGDDGDAFVAKLQVITL